MIIGDINGKVLGIITKADSYIGLMKGWSEPFFVLDILFVLFILYVFYLFLRQTRALGIVYGIFVLFLIWIIAQILQLNLLITILRWIFTSILVAIPVVFQPELRNVLEKLGRSTKFVTDISRIPKNGIETMVDEILKATVILSQNKYGALIVIGRHSGLQEYIDTGDKIFANLNSKLLVNIFTPKAPLHDGAVIIKGNKIASASATLPLSDEVMDLSLGTRHKAALSLSSITDSISLIVSEETGAISIAVDGRLQRNLNQDDLRDRLVKLLTQSPIKFSKNKK